MKNYFRSVMFLFAIIIVFQTPQITHAEKMEHSKEGYQLREAPQPIENGYVIIETKDENGNLVYKRVTTEYYEEQVERIDQSVDTVSPLPEIRLVQKDYIRYADPTPKKLGPNAWGKHRIGADFLMIQIAEKQRVIVAVIDSGVDHTHPFLKNRLIPGYDFVDQDDDPMDMEGHGTHVAGIIADATNSNVKIMPVRVLDDYGEGNDFDISEGIRYAADHGATIINLSLGGPGDSPIIREAIDYAIEKRVLVVVAAGNERQDTKHFFPASYDPVIVVASTDNDDTLSVFSNYGESVDLAAPGSNIDSSVIGGIYEEMSGTSMAAPYVTGVAALLKSENPALTSREIETILLQYTDDLGDDGWDPYYGEGILNVSQYRLKEDRSSLSIISPNRSSTQVENMSVKVFTENMVGEKLTVLVDETVVAEKAITQDGYQSILVPLQFVPAGKQKFQVQVHDQMISLNVNVQTYKNTFSIENIHRQNDTDFELLVYGIPYQTNRYSEYPDLLNTSVSMGSSVKLKTDFEELKEDYQSIVVVTKSSDPETPLYVREITENGVHHFMPDNRQKLSFTNKLSEAAEYEMIYTTIRLAVNDVLLPELPLYEGFADEALEFYVDKGNHFVVYRGYDFTYHSFTDNKDIVSLVADATTMFNYNFMSRAKVGAASEGETIEGDYTYVSLYSKQNPFIKVWEEGLDELFNPMYLKNDDYRAIVTEYVDYEPKLTVYRDFNRQLAAKNPKLNYGGPITGGFKLNTAGPKLSGAIDFKDSFGNKLYTNDSYYDYIGYKMSPQFEYGMDTKVQLINTAGKSLDTDVSGDNQFEFNQVKDGHYLLRFDYKNELFPVRNTSLQVEVKNGRFVGNPADNKQPIVLQKVVESTITKGDTYTLDLNSVFSDPEQDPLTFTTTAGTIENAMLTFKANEVTKHTITVSATDSFSPEVSAIVKLVVTEGSSGFPENHKEFKRKMNVPINKIWTITVNKEFEPTDVRSVEVLKGGQRHKINLHYQSILKNILVLPLEDYEKGQQYEMQVLLKSGKAYRLMFETVH